MKKEDLRYLETRLKPKQEAEEVGLTSMGLQLKKKEGRGKGKISSASEKAEDGDQERQRGLSLLKIMIDQMDRFGGELKEIHKGYWRRILVLGFG